MDEAPTIVEKVPEGHESHEDAPDIDANVPAAHNSHVVLTNAPTARENDPGEHF